MNQPSYITEAAGGEPSKGGINAPFGAVERKIARRYLGAKKKDGGVAIIAWISFICITLAIAAMIIIMSIMNGFRGVVLELTLGSEGHVYVQMWSAEVSPETVLEIENKLAAIPEVDTAIELSEEWAGFVANESFMAGRIIGVSPGNLDTFKLVSENVKYGSLQGFGQGRGAAHQIAMGDDLAGHMGLNVGDRVNIITPRVRNSPGGARMPVMKYYTVGAIFDTGLYRTDSTTIYMDLDQSQLLFNSGKKEGEVQLRLHDPDDVDKVRKRVTEVLDYPVQVTTWKRKFEQEARALRIEQIAMRFIFVIVVIISTFPILAAMLMLVKNKARDIAILRTIGSTRASIMRIFLTAGTLVGIFGTIAGLTIGILFCVFIEPIQRFIEFFTGPLFDQIVYGVGNGVIPVKIVWAEVFWVALCGFIVSAFATLLPAISASRTDPVEALRYE